MSIRIAIIDDEPLVRQGIETLIAARSNIEVVARCGSGPEAIQAIEASRPDLLLLDVQMPIMDGFETLEALEVDPLPAVIFVTAHDEYALRAFDVHAVDYVLKPFDDERLLTALARARSRLTDSAAAARRLRALLARRDLGARYMTRFVVRRSGSIEFVACADVCAIRACDNYVVLHDLQRQTHMVRATIKNLARRLDPDEFCRVHRSAIVRLDAICRLRPRPSGDADVELREGSSIAVSRRYKAELLTRLAALGRNPARGRGVDCVRTRPGRS